MFKYFNIQYSNAYNIMHIKCAYLITCITSDYNRQYYTFGVSGRKIMREFIRRESVCRTGFFGIPRVKEDRR